MYYHHYVLSLCVTIILCIQFRRTSIAGEGREMAKASAREGPSELRGYPIIVPRVCGVGHNGLVDGVCVVVLCCVLYCSVVLFRVG